jgi:hypothetical protein
MRIQSALLPSAALVVLLTAATEAPRTAALKPTLWVETTLQAHPLTAATCTDRFVAHDLPHTSQGRQQPARGYDGNGSGLALGDLNNDGLIDLVLASQVGGSSLLWNRGGLRFERQTLETINARAVAAVDVDADGWLDIAFTNNLGRPNYWRNERNGTFTPTSLEGITTPAFTFLWDDLQGRGQLDLVTGSYDSLLEAETKNSFLFSTGAGVMLYLRNPNGSYQGQQLANKSHALGLTTFDLNHDGQPEVMVGNDFDLPDMAWQPTDWASVPIFPLISKHTMGFAVSDIDNNGRPELFSTDMKPDFRDIKTIAPWIPLMEKGYKQSRRSGRQKAENMLQSSSGSGYRNVAYRMGLDATGWSWSAKFGDLDNDGFEDLYAVNGMIDQELFPYLPNGELVEENVVFANQQGRAFVRRPDWGLGSLRSGRAMSMADLDHDGDLEIVVNNLGQPAQLFENQLCGGHSVQVELRWPGTGNTQAIGSQGYLTVGSQQLWRRVTSVSGFIAGDAPRLHFGFEANQAVGPLEVVWPDGVRSRLEAVQPNTRLTLTRNQGGQP